MQKFTKGIRTLAFALCLVLAAGFILPFAANAEGPAESPDPKISEVKENVPPIAYVRIEYRDVANGEYLGECYVDFERTTNNVVYADQLTNIPEGYELYDSFPYPVADGDFEVYDILLKKIGDTSDPVKRHVYIRYIDSRTGEKIGNDDNIWFDRADKFFDPYRWLFANYYAAIPEGYLPVSYDPAPIPTDSEVFEYQLEPIEYPDEPGYMYLRLDYGVKDPAFGGFHTIATERIIVPKGEDIELTAEDLNAVPDGYKVVRKMPIYVQTNVQPEVAIEIEKIEDPTDPSVPEPSDPAETDPTDPVETDPTVPEPSDPVETDPTVPETSDPVETDPTVPETSDPVETDPTVPETTDPVETDPTVPETTKPAETDPTVPETTEPKAEDIDVPDTGDETNLAVLTAVTVIALTGAAVLVVSLKKNQI